LEFGFEELQRRETERVERIRVFVNGSLLPLDTPPTIVQGEVLLPLRAVFEWLGYTLEWQRSSSLAHLTHDNGRSHTFFVGRNIAIINGQVHTGNMPARMIGGRIFVSMDFVALATGTWATWDRDTGVMQFNRNPV
jgi:hypothetical protein